MAPLSYNKIMVQLHVPVGPKGHWFGGNLPEFRKARLDFFVHCARDYGDFVKLRFAHRRIFLVSHPVYIEEILVTQSKNFHQALCPAAQSDHPRQRPVHQRRRLLAAAAQAHPARFCRSRIASYAAAMVTATQRHITQWKPDERRDIHEEMMGVTLAIAAKTLFNTEVGNDAKAVAHAMEVMQTNFLERFNSFIPTPLWLPTPANLPLRSGRARPTR